MMLTTSKAIDSSSAPIRRSNISGKEPCRARFCAPISPVSMIVTRVMRRSRTRAALYRVTPNNISTGGFQDASNLVAVGAGRDKAVLVWCLRGLVAGELRLVQLELFRDGFRDGRARA